MLECFSRINHKATMHPLMNNLVLVNAASVGKCTTFLHFNGNNDTVLTDGASTDPKPQGMEMFQLPINASTILGTVHGIDGLDALQAWVRANAANQHAVSHVLSLYYRQNTAGIPEDLDRFAQIVAEALAADVVMVREKLLSLLRRGYHGRYFMRHIKKYLSS